MSGKTVNRTKQNLQVQNTDSKNELHVEFERLIQNQSNYIKRLFREILDVNHANALVIHDYINAEQAEINIQESTKSDKIKKLCLLSRFFRHRKNFSEMNKSDILSYLNSLRKSNDDDPTHKSIGTYNGRQMVFMKFFRWLYNPNEPDHRNRITPPCMVGVKSLPRKEKSTFKPEDMWTADDHAIFLKYCPEPRDRCWHSIVCDTSARPHEILNLRISDIKFKIGDNGTQYAEIHVHGKTTPRTLPLIGSIPYVKDWHTKHPLANIPDSKLFVSLGRANYGQPLTRDGLLKHYQSYYRDIYFPNLLKDPNLLIQDKEAIRRLLGKPWNLYVLRHSALTQKSKILKEATLRDHAGWTTNSKMPSVYLHYFGTESCKSLLESCGIINQDSSRTATLLPTKQCPSCRESNKPDSRFCAKCKTVLTYDAYEETIQKEQRRDSEVQTLKERYDQDIKTMREQIQKMDHILEIIRYNPKLARIKPEVLLNRKPVNK